MFSMKVKFDHQRVLDQDFNSVEEMDDAFKMVKKKFKGDD
jgi:hypothetical protein